MVIPKQSEMEEPLLETIYELGGRAKTTDIYKNITKRFPQLTKEDLELKQKNGTTIVWWNRIQWVRQKLILTGELISIGHGIWAITNRGLERIGKNNILSLEEWNQEQQNEELIYKPIEQLNIEDIVERYEYEDHCIIINKKRIINCKYYNVRHPSIEIQKLINQISATSQNITQFKSEIKIIKKSFSSPIPESLQQNNLKDKRSEWKKNIEELLKKVESKQKITKKIDYDIAIVDADTPITIHDLLKKNQEKTAIIINLSDLH